MRLLRGAFSRKAKWRWIELSRISLQLGRLLQAGIPILPALEILREQGGKRREEISTLISSLSSGESLAKSLQAINLPPFYISMVGMAEFHGEIAQSLRMIGEWYGRMDRLRREMIGKLVYPIFLFISSFFLLLFFIAVILPQFEQLFRAFAGEMPPGTLLLLSVSRWIREHPFLIIFLFFLLIVGISLLIRALRKRGEGVRFLLPLPVVGELFRTIYTIRISSQMGLLLEAGLGIQEGLQAISERTRGKEMGELIRAMEEHLLEGNPLSSFRPPYPLLKKEFYRLAALGESLGTLGEQLLQYSYLLEEEFRRQGETMARWVEPFTLLILGGVLAFLILSIFVPLFQIMQTI